MMITSSTNSHATSDYLTPLSREAHPLTGWVRAWMGIDAVQAIALKERRIEELHAEQETIVRTLQRKKPASSGEEHEGFSLYRTSRRVAKVFLAILHVLLRWIVYVGTCGVYTRYLDNTLSQEIQRLSEENLAVVNRRRVRETELATSRENRRVIEEGRQRIFQLQEQVRGQNETLQRLTQELQQGEKTLAIDAEKVEALQVVGQRLQGRLAVIEQIFAERQGAIEPIDMPPVPALSFKDQPVVAHYPYPGLTSAAQVFEVCFREAWNDLLGRGRRQGKIRLNDSSETMFSPGACVVYRQMIVFLLERGIIVKNGQGEEALALNERLHLLPSKPVRAMYQAGADWRVGFFCLQRDLFTPSDRVIEEVTEGQGVNAVLAKRLWNHLGRAERARLLDLLMEPVIFDTHPDLMDTREWMEENAGSECALLIRNVERLVKHLAVAFERQFMYLLHPLWSDVAQGEMDPFDKSIVRPMEIQKERVVPWEVNWAVVEEGTFFSAAVVEMQQEYAELFQYVESGAWVLANRKCDHVWRRVTWEDVNPQYHVAHAVFQEHDCLFSALLTLIVADAPEADPVRDNRWQSRRGDHVWQLRRAMANYLEALEAAREEEQYGVAAEGSHKEARKRMAEEADAIEAVIGVNYQSNLATYTNWLRNQSLSNANYERRDDGKGGTEVEIMIFAHMMGVRVGLILLGSRAQSGQEGQLMPQRLYGPITKEMLFLATDGANAGGLDKTYHALFPRWVRDTGEPLHQDVVNPLCRYWDQIAINKRWNEK